MAGRMWWEVVHVNARERETLDGKRAPGRRGGVWGPGRRWGHTCNAVRGGRQVYVFGGFGEDKRHFNDVHVFDTVRQTWSKPMIKGVPPSPRDSHTCTTVGNRLFVFGGTDGKIQLNDLCILDTSNNTWILPITHGKVPDAREGHGAALIGKRLFIFGGCAKVERVLGEGQEEEQEREEEQEQQQQQQRQQQRRRRRKKKEVYYDDLYILDTENLTWELGITSGTRPSARDSHTCSAWREQLIVLGGEDASDCYLSDVFMLDTDTMVWKELNTSGQMLTPRAGHSTVAVGRNLFVFGGFAAEKNLYNDLHVLNIDTGIWNRMTNVSGGPSPRFSAAADCVDSETGILVLIGGCNRLLWALDDMYYLHTDIQAENGGLDGEQEKLSFGMDLKSKCQESRCEHDCSVHEIGMTSDSSRTGRILHNSNPVGEGRFEARVVSRVFNGYALEACISGQLLHGIVFSHNPHLDNGRHHQIIKNMKRMRMDSDARLGDERRRKLETLNATHQARQCTSEGVNDQAHTTTALTIDLLERESPVPFVMTMVPADVVTKPGGVSLNRPRLHAHHHGYPHSG